MSSTDTNRHESGTSTTTIEVAPWQLAEIRRQLYIDLRGIAEHITAEADRAAQMNANDNAQRALGDDLRSFVHGTFADAISLLDRIGWDVNGDTGLLVAHAQRPDEVDAAEGETI